MFNTEARFAGDTIDFNFTVQNSDFEPEDITGATALFRMILGANTIDKTVGNGLTIVDPLTGRIDVVLEPADTDSAKTSGATAEYELQIVQGTAINTVFLGSLQLLRNII